jgi:hypothetical protein
MTGDKMAPLPSKMHIKHYPLFPHHINDAILEHSAGTSIRIARITKLADDENTVVVEFNQPEVPEEIKQLVHNLVEKRIITKRQDIVK